MRFEKGGVPFEYFHECVSALQKKREVVNVSRCSKCEFAHHDQFKGFCGRWLCLHPYRNEISNSGTFTYPANDNPRVTICETVPESYNNLPALADALEEVETPLWCYFEAVERAKQLQPGFNPDKQRAILWPGRVG